MAWTARTLCLALPLATTSALAQVLPDYGHEFLTIGAPGNRATLPSETPGHPSLNVGAVGYEFRMSRTKVSVPQYIEFATAYAPFYDDDPWDYDLTGPYLLASQQPGGAWAYSPRPTCENAAASITWPMAARYCNWLHNGKVNEAWAFETGAYDTSTFNFVPGNWSAQTEPSPGAKYWIPNLDEQTKALYYDPDRYGPGQEGYWIYPNGSDSVLVAGLPENGGETIGDLMWLLAPGQLAWPLEQYPDVQTPWGLIDVSGTVPEYTSTVKNWNTHSLYTGGSLADDPLFISTDRIDTTFGGGFWGSALGSLRIASAVPAPGPAALFGTAFLFLRRRNR